MIQSINWHMHTDSFYTLYDCQFTRTRIGSVASQDGEDNFEYYHTINTLHRCTLGDNART